MAKMATSEAIEWVKPLCRHDHSTPVIRLVHEERQALRTLIELAERLPVTADGVRVVPQIDTVWGYGQFTKKGSMDELAPEKLSCGSITDADWHDGQVEFCCPNSNSYFYLNISECYSTKAAAIAAREGGGE